MYATWPQADEPTFNETTEEWDYPEVSAAEEAAWEAFYERIFPIEDNLYDVLEPARDKLQIKLQEINDKKAAIAAAAEEKKEIARAAKEKSEKEAAAKKLA
jgi:hypothetical protein